MKTLRGQNLYLTLCFELKQYILICSEEKEFSLFLSPPYSLLSDLHIFCYHYITKDYNIYILFCNYNYHSCFVSFMYLKRILSLLSLLYHSFSISEFFILVYPQLTRFYRDGVFQKSLFGAMFSMFDMFMNHVCSLQT